MFFRKEMELTGRLSPCYTRVTYWLYHLVSDYGHSYWRPIAGMGGYGPFGAYFTRFISWPETSCICAWTGWSFSSASRACLLRIFFAVFGFYRRFPSDLLADPTFWTVLLTVSETLLGFVFLFFLGLGLRTRFRLR